MQPKKQTTPAEQTGRLLGIRGVGGAILTKQMSFFNSGGHSRQVLGYHIVDAGLNWHLAFSESCHMPAKPAVRLRKDKIVC
jgi:hypothetical protein